MTNEETTKLLGSFLTVCGDAVMAQLLTLPLGVKGDLVNRLDELAGQLEATMQPVEDASAAQEAQPEPGSSEVARAPAAAFFAPLSDAELRAEMERRGQPWLSSVPDIVLVAEMSRRGLMPVPYTRS